MAGLHTFYECVGRRLRFMARDKVDAPFAKLPADGRLALCDRTILLFVYNTSARVSEVALLRVEQLSLTTPAQVRWLGKGGKWRSCPLWNQTAQLCSNY